LEKLQKNYDVDIHWRSFQLRPPGSRPIPPELLKRFEASRPMFAQRAREQYGVEVNAGPININSRPALIVEKFADTQGKGEAFHRAVMHAYWQEAKIVEDRHVLEEVATGVGLHFDDFSAILENPEFDAAVSADIELAQEYGLTGVPAVVFADKYLIMGAQPYDVFRQAAEKVLAEI
jgi:predicted DsbA family dithiol-disulfide isomerase